MIEEQSKQSQSNSVPIENDSTSGNYVLAEKARNMTSDRAGGLSGTQKTSAIGESSSLANDELRHAGSTQLMAGNGDPPAPANKSNSAQKSAKKEAGDDYDDDYVDDVFDVEEEEESGSGQLSSLKPVTNLPKYDSNANHSSQRDFKEHMRSGGPPSQTEIDFHLSGSQPVLPPLAAGRKADADAVMSAFVVNLAESGSFDYQISTSMGAPGEGAARRLTQQTKVKRERDNSLGDGTESMHSSDFAVSQSKLSSSAFGSFDAKATSGQRSSKQKQRSAT